MNNDIQEFLKDSTLKSLERAYFPDEPKIDGIEIKNIVSRQFEDIEIVKKRLNEGKVDSLVVGWKAGRLIKDGENKYIYKLNGDIEKYYLNGYGSHISEIELKKYLNNISRLNVSDKSYLVKDFKMDAFIEEFEKLYDSLNNDNCQVPKNFGSVYIINLIYFKSKGVFPIYDKFAHKALKGLTLNIKPCFCYIGDAPAKDKYEDIANLYREYIMLINNTIGYKNYYDSGRKIDRALWVYGHASNSFKGLDSI